MALRVPTCDESEFTNGCKRDRGSRTLFIGKYFKLIVSLFYSYSVTGFLDKNKDNLYQDFKRLLYNRYPKIILIQNLCSNVDGFLHSYHYLLDNVTKL